METCILKEATPWQTVLQRAYLRAAAITKPRYPKEWGYAGLKLKKGLIKVPIMPVIFTGAATTDIHKQS